MHRQYGSPWEMLPPRWFETAAALSVAVLVECLFAAQTNGQQETLKKQIVLLEASQDNSQVERPISAGNHTVGLSFQVDPSTRTKPAKLEATAFIAEGTPQYSLIPTLRAPGSEPPKKPGELDVPQIPEKLIVELRFEGVRPKTSYKGRLHLFSEGKHHSWEMTLKAGEFPILAVDKIAPQQLIIYNYNPFTWNKRHPQFPILLRSKSGDGPYTRLRVRVEDPNQAKSTGITSNFTVDALSFWSCAGGCAPLNLWSRGSGSSQGSNQEDRIDDARTVSQDSQRTIWARVESLGAGEYSPILRFMADGASETAEESKLALTLQIRHHWFFPVLVILLGSLAGWIGSKYVIGYRTARALKHDAKTLSETAAFLARPDPRISGWRVPGESASYALVRVRVILHQVEYLTTSIFTVIAGEQGIRDRLAEAKRRLDALQAFRMRRLALQELALDRPAVQRRVGETLRRTLNILDRPTFGEDQKSEFDALLKRLEDWVGPDQVDELYRGVVKAQISELRTRVTEVAVPHGIVRDSIRKLLEELGKYSDRVESSEIPAYDRKAAALALLWRDRNQRWAGILAQQQNNGEPLEVLYEKADEGIWERIKDAAKAGGIRLYGVTEAKSYDLVEVRLGLVESDAFSESYLIRHPCQVYWKVTLPSIGQREVVTDGLTFAQYFQDQGTYEVSAYFDWRGEQTGNTAGKQIKIEKNPEYRRRAAFDWWIEGAVTSLALLFAVLTGLQSQYGPTFGSFGQYTGLFLWAAGASTGGNLFKQLGTGRTAGGQEAPQSGK